MSVSETPAKAELPEPREEGLRSDEIDYSIWFYGLLKKEDDLLLTKPL